MANSSVESDDAFTRRLQAQEMEIMQPHSGIDAQTPLMVDGRVRHETSNIPLILQTSNALHFTEIILYACLFYSSKLRMGIKIGITM